MNKNPSYGFIKHNQESVTRTITNAHMIPNKIERYINVLKSLHQSITLKTIYPHQTTYKMEKAFIETRYPNL